jgi:hypothetical protein
MLGYGGLSPASLRSALPPGTVSAA